MARSDRSRRAPARRPPAPPDKRSFPGWLAAAFVIVLLAAGGGGWWWANRTPAPGAVVLISIDTLRADHLPLYGYTKGETPRLDAFAKDGVLFERAYSHAPQTLPEHTSILTGLLPFEHGVRDNLGFTLASDKTTLATRLHAAGYRTAGFVSAYVLRPDTGISQGFDTYNAALPAAAADVSPGDVRRPGEETLAAAKTWLDAQPDDHFFLFFHIYEPHRPYAPPARYASLAPYDAEIAYSDEIVGHLLDDLKARGWYRDAIVTVMADHGEGLGEHGELEHGIFLYDDTIHVPWITKLPGNRSGGRRVDAPIQHIDYVPTMLSLLGLPRPGGLRGRDLSPLLFGTGQVAAQGVYSEALYPRYHFGWSELQALTDERYRYIKAPRPELYDLERDPGERTNVIADHARAAAAMRAGLAALVAGHGVDAPTAVSAEDRARLAALGYIGTQFSADTGTPGSSLPDPKDMAPVLQKYRQAVTLLEQHDQAGGAKLLREILDGNPKMTDVWAQYAVVLTRLGRNAEALDAYQHIIRLNPDEPSGPLGAAAALMALGRDDEARAHAELAVARAPASAHEMLARIALDRKDNAEALRQADLAAKADPTLPMPLFVKGLVQYNQGHYAEALPLLEQARDQWSKRTMQTADLRFYIGDCLARLERYPDAEQAFRAELSLYPSSTRARTGLAMLYQATGRTDQVAAVIDQMLKTAPSPATYDTAAQLWQMFGEPDRAAAVRAAAKARFGR
jgi:arylsulfatase A-like enzyme/Flp pilus assembly protein TadD